MFKKISLGLVAATALASSPAFATIIDNDIAAGTLGHWSVDVTTGGESRSADITANRKASADVFTEDTLYDYFTYIDIGAGGFRLSGSAVSVTGDDEVTSSGSFVGSNGNTILWTAVSAIPDGGSVMTTTYSFVAETGELGNLRLFQYMDEDIESVSDDVFFTRGSAATFDLELFTVDNTEVYGVSHGGAYTDAQGLSNASFAGWALCDYNNMKPAISGGTQTVSPTGVFGCGLSSFSHPDVGTVWGPDDIVSVLAWDAVRSATSAIFLTTLGGVPDFRDIPPVDRVPEPAALGLLGLGLAAVAGLRRRKRA